MNRNDFLMMREDLMERLENLVDVHLVDRPHDDLVADLCDMICEVMDPAGLHDM